MKVFLLKDVPGVGQRGQVIEVKDGYGRNFLVRNGLGQVATDSILKEAARQKTILDKKQATKEEELAAMLSRLKAHTIEFKRKVNEKGHLFDAVDAKDIVASLEHSGYSNIKKDHISGVPLKSVGEHDVNVHVGGRDIVIKVRIHAL